MKGQGMQNQQSPMPPAPPSTIVKTSKPGVTATPGKQQQADFIDDFTRKLEASLNLINQANNLTVVTNESEEHHSHTVTVTHEHHHSHQQHHQTTENHSHQQQAVNAAKQSTPNSTRKKKEGEEFINSIPVVEEGHHSPMSP
jgi:ABC-type Zn2+ transport system substrate-binding protein/surface adhesin